MKWILIFLSSSCLASYEPWYTGPMIATTASNEPVGSCYIAPIAYAGNFYGIYNNQWNCKKTHDLYQLNYIFDIQIGLVREFIDVEVAAQAFTNFFRGQRRTSWGDTTAGFGIHLTKEDVNGSLPEMRLLLPIIMPSGKYKALDANLNGFDGVGKGSWTFSPVFIARKMFAIYSDHPFRLNLNLNYSMGTTTSIQGRSVYGGSKLTHGSVKPGHQILTNLSFEVSLNQRWVIVVENIYQHAFKSTFSGQGGGSRVGLPSSDIFSIATELEYNVTQKYGWIGGLWFSVAGRNIPSFVTLALSSSINF
jgi:hypothetical protein